MAAAGLQGLTQPADQMGGEEEQADADPTTQRKRLDAWAVSWDKWILLILELTRSNDRCEPSLHDTDMFKTALHTPRQNRPARLLPRWEVDIQTYTVGIQGSHDHLDRWQAQLRRFGVTAARLERLMRDMVSQTLTELNGLYSVRYAAQQHAHNA
jgi:hypothetical protein